MKNLTDKEKMYYEKHLRQDIASEFEEEKDSETNQKIQADIILHKITITQYHQEKDNC